MNLSINRKFNVFDSSLSLLSFEGNILFSSDLYRNVKLEHDVNFAKGKIPVTVPKYHMSGTERVRLMDDLLILVSIHKSLHGHPNT